MYTHTLIASAVLFSSWATCEMPKSPKAYWGDDQGLKMQLFGIGSIHLLKGRLWEAMMGVVFADQAIMIEGDQGD